MARTQDFILTWVAAAFMIAVAGCFGAAVIVPAAWALGLPVAKAAAIGAATGMVAVIARMAKVGLPFGSHR